MKISSSLALASALLAAALAPVQAQPAGGGIYSCKGRISDKPILDCPDDQNELNKDGSRKRIVPRPPTEAEKEVAEARKRDAEALEAERRRIERADKMLLNRFPNEAAHNAARKEALDAVHNSIRISEARIKLLLGERKPLLDESEFYTGKPLPDKLKRALDANDASLAAQKSLRQNQQEELQRINARFDQELDYVKKLLRARP